jgi:hypothetical protein
VKLYSGIQGEAGESKHGCERLTIIAVVIREKAVTSVPVMADTKL